MSLTRQIIIGTLVLVALGALIFQAVKLRSIPASNLSTLIQKGQIVATSARIIYEPSSTSLHGFVVLAVDSPSRIDDVNKLHNDGFLIVSDTDRFTGDTGVAVDSAIKFGRPCDSHVLPESVTIYRVHPGALLTQAASADISVIRVLSTGGVPP